MNRWEREIVCLEEEHIFLTYRLRDLDRTEPNTDHGREYRRRLRADIAEVAKDLARAREMAELVELMEEEAA